eukprot:348853_1
MEDLFMRSLLSPKTNVQQLSSAVKYDYMMQLLAKLSDIEQVYAFLLSFKTELHHLIGNDMESWCVFVHYMLSVCQIPQNESIVALQLSGTAIKVMELTSESFCFKVQLINGPKEAEMFYKLCTDYPVILDDKIRESISSNTYLNTKPIFIHLLQPSFNNKLLLIKDKESQPSIRIATGTVVGQSWATLDNKQQHALQSTCDALIQRHEFHIAASIINGIMQSVNMFSKDKTDADIVLYLASANGGEILKLLNKYKDHEELGIECHINSFLQFWKQALSNVEEIMNHFVCINAMVQKFGGIAPKSIPQYVNQNEGFVSMDQDDEKNPPKVIVDDTIKSILKTHSLRLKDWRKDEAVLQSICNSDDIINSNFEGEKQDADSTQSEQLLHQQSKCNDLIRTQSARLESLPQNVREVFVKQRAIKDAVKQHELISKQRQDMLNQIKREYSECNRRRKDLQHQLVTAYKQFNGEMNQESILLQQQRKLEETIVNEGSSLTTTGQYDESTNIIASYQLYQKNTRIFIQKVQERLQNEWDKREQEWWEWTVFDCLVWMRHKLQWFKEEAIPRAIDLKTIQKNMDDLGLTGRMIESMQKEQLQEIGFGFKQMDVLYPAIKHLCSSYPAPKRNDKDMDRKRTNVEGMIEETYNNDVDIPDRFKCCLTKQIMDHPVIAFDGNTYDRDAIILYLKQHHKSPVTKEACVGDDETSFMLFDDEKLKREINIFKKANNL